MRKPGKQCVGQNIEFLLKLVLLPEICDMKRKDIKEIRAKTQKELENLLEEAKVSLVKLKMDLKTAKTKNVHALARKRDEIAQILTIIEEKKVLEEEK